jgi:hypothetical protein
MPVHSISYPIQETVLLTTETCANCGVLFAVPDWFKNQRRKDHGTFYCPSGHSLVYNGPTEAEKEAKRYKEWYESEQRLARQRSAALMTERRKHAATKGQLTKTRKRAAAALCPVDGCKRHIVQLERHLRTKHPDYTPPAA